MHWLLVYTFNVLSTIDCKTISFVKPEKGLGTSIVFTSTFIITVQIIDIFLIIFLMYLMIHSAHSYIDVRHIFIRKTQWLINGI